MSSVIADAAGKLRVVPLDRDCDGIAQVAHHLRERRSIDLLMIAVADERGCLSLGSSRLTVGNLYAYEDNLRRIGAALSPAGRIQILGRNGRIDSCDRPLLIMLSRLAGATVESCAGPDWAILRPDLVEHGQRPAGSRMVA